MLISNLELANNAARIYAPPPGYYAHLIQVDPDAPYVGVAYRDGYDEVDARGSRTPQDWLRDLRSEASCAVAGYEQFGHLPYGFARGLAKTAEAVHLVLRPGVPVGGSAHSLGGPENLYLMAALFLMGHEIARIGAFECPNPGTPTFTAFMARFDIVTTHNVGDPVPDLPVPVPPLLPWEPVRAPLSFDLGPQPSVVDPFARHGIALVQQFFGGQT